MNRNRIILTKHPGTIAEKRVILMKHPGTIIYFPFKSENIMKIKEKRPPVRQKTRGEWPNRPLKRRKTQGYENKSSLFLRASSNEIIFCCSFS